MKRSFARKAIPNLLLSSLALIASGCGAIEYNNELPRSSELGRPQSYTIARVITHSHSVYSYDACDKHGITDGVLDATCVQLLRGGICKNHVNFLFLTDHPDHMQEYEMSDLLLKGERDVLLSKSTGPYANEVHSCEDGFVPMILQGFEGKIIAMGMTHHLDPSVAVRGQLYQSDTLDVRNRLRDEADALVMAPHTEGKSIEWLTNLQPDAIEIYNFHANLDPKIRKRDLHLAPFKDIPSLFNYMVDPFHSLIPDMSFVNFLQLSPVYAEKWDRMVYSGMKVTGLGATDSHQNILKEKGADGERLDSHRRIMRIMSNHVLVESLDPDLVKNAIKKGRSWMVFEGFGSPVGMDFFATSTDPDWKAVVGESKTIVGTVTLHVKRPSLHSSNPHGKEKPGITLRLKQVLADGKDQVVATSDSGDLEYVVTAPGSYRAEASIVPKHLREYLGHFSDKVDEEFPWIITNHIHLSSN